MSASDQPRAITRRQLFRYAGGAAAVATVGGGMKLLQPSAVRQLVTGAGSHMSKPVADLFIGGTDGWISLPASPAIPPFHPDVYAPSGLTTYIFGFRNITDLDAADRIGQKNHAQHQAPLFWVKEFVPGTPGSPTEFDGEFVVDITNLGLAQRPDLFDAHTLHWHGFRNVIPFFDGEPTGSVSVPAGTVFRYVYRPRDPGTYMYHCHVEDVEHVHMGMTGIVFVRPKQDGNTSLYPSGKYLYNDGNGSTGFDREFVMFLTEVWAEAHWADAHIQLPEWSDYKPDFALLNGRVYPDTILPGAPFPAGSAVIPSAPPVGFASPALSGSEPPARSPVVVATGPAAVGPAAGGSERWTQAAPAAASTARATVGPATHDSRRRRRDRPGGVTSSRVVSSGITAGTSHAAEPPGCTGSPPPGGGPPPLDL